MITLPTQSSTIRDYAAHDGFVFIFSSAGVDIYRTSYVEWVRVGFAALDNVTSGAVSTAGIWLGTSDRGVWHCPLGTGDLTSQVQQYYSVDSTYYIIQSDVISHVSAHGLSLLITHDAGADFAPAIGETFKYVDELGCGSCAVNDTYLAYAVDAGMHTLALPLADWDVSDVTILDTVSSPALSSNAVNHLEYGLGDNLAIATGSGINIYDYVDITTIASGNIPFVWSNSIMTQSAGDIVYIDSSADAIIYNVATSSAIKSSTGPYTAAWIDDQADLSLYGAGLERHAYIDFISPSNESRNVTRDWSLYFEIGDTIHNMDSITVKVNDITVSPDISSLGSGFSSGFSSGFGGTGFKVTYTPPSASGYLQTIKVEITGIDSIAQPFTEIVYFTTETVENTAPSATKPPNVVLTKDLSLTDSEDIYQGVGVNWHSEKVSSFYVDEEQARAAAAVAVENGIYHTTNITIQVLGVDDSLNNTQDISRGDIVLVDVDALNLSSQKCEVLAVQRVVAGDRIEYNIKLAFYELWT